MHIYLAARKAPARSDLARSDLARRPFDASTLPFSRLTVLCIALLLMLTVAGCGKANSMMLEDYLQGHQTELAIPANPQGAAVRFEVPPGTPAKAIGAALLEKGLITDATLFEAYVRANGLATELEAGDFVLSPAMTLAQIVEELQHARRQGIVVGIPEGWRLEQTADMLAATNTFSDSVDGHSPQAEDYRAIGRSGELGAEASYPFLQDRPGGTGLEGYLFPDTYELDAEQPLARDLILRQLDVFAERVVPLYNAALQEGRTTLSLHDVVTLASIVEREAVLAEERPRIAGVYLNRLAAGMTLDADPTVQYAMGFQPESGQWWKTPVSLEEYASVVSPYNTYLNLNLPPGPIASPGLSSIQAVLAPEKHNYLYFVALPDKSGGHVFAETYDEQVANVQKYLNGQ